MPIYAQSSTLRNLTIPLVDVDFGTLQQDQVLQYNATTGKFENTILTSGGQAIITTASNVGAGAEVFKQKTVQDLEFKTITAGAGIVITDGADEISIASNLALTTASNLGSGEQVFKTKVADDFQFRSIAIDPSSINLTIATVGDQINISSTAEINTASNVGTGTGLFAQKSFYDLQFKSLVAGNNITITNNANEVFIASSTPANTASSYQFGVTFDGNGDVDSITDVPAGWTITRIGNIITASHPLNKMPKSISYWGKDSVNGWQYRLPTAGYQALIDAGDELINFQIDINATAAGADASSEAKVNVIF